jgi:hypothetical protein
VLQCHPEAIAEGSRLRKRQKREILRWRSE